MDAFSYYLYGTAGWLALQAAPLTTSPTLVVALLSPDVRPPSPLEAYFGRALGIALGALCVLVVLLAGAVPLTSAFSDSSPAAPRLDDPKAPYAFPALAITTAYHAIVAFYCYTRWVEVGCVGFGIGALVGGALAAVGGWVVLFGTGRGTVVGGAGVDRRASGWPFGNREADKKRKARKGL